MTEKINIILIEDNPGDSRLIKEYLKECRAQAYEVTEFGCLKDFFQNIQGIDSDIILLDLSLPDSSGLHTLIKVFLSFPKTAIVVLTGLNDEDLAIEAMRHGAQDYLMKGEISGGSLRRSVRYAVERKDVQKSLRVRTRIIESSINPIATTDTDGLLTYVNDAFIKPIYMLVNL